MVKIEKVLNRETFHTEIQFTIGVSEDFIQEHFMHNRINSASINKTMIMEIIGKAYEDYVKGLAKEDDMEYFDEEFGAVKVIDERFYKV